MRGIVLANERTVKRETSRVLKMEQSIGTRLKFLAGVGNPTCAVLTTDFITVEIMLLTR